MLRVHVVELHWTKNRAHFKKSISCSMCMEFSDIGKKIEVILKHQLHTPWAGSLAKTGSVLP